MRQTIKRLHDEMGYDLSEINFLHDSQKWLVQCRRLMKWSYSYGFYLEGKKEIELYEYLQACLEVETENLSYHTERKFDVFFEENGRENLAKHKDEIIKSMEITKKFFKNLIEGLKQGGLTNNKIN